MVSIGLWKRCTQIKIFQWVEMVSRYIKANFRALPGGDRQGVGPLAISFHWVKNRAIHGKKMRTEGMRALLSSDYKWCDVCSWAGVWWKKNDME